MTWWVWLLLGLGLLAAGAGINRAEGQKQQVLEASEATRQRQINEAEGQAEAILAIAKATAEGLRAVAEQISQRGGYEAVQLRVAENYLVRFGELAKAGTTMILPTNLADVAAMVQTAMSAVKQAQAPPPAAAPPPAR